VGGGQWHERHAALGDLPHFTRIDNEQQRQQPLTAATSSDDQQLEHATDGLKEIDIS